MRKKTIYVIINNLPDGPGQSINDLPKEKTEGFKPIKQSLIPHYYAGISKIPMGTTYAVGIEWSLKYSDAIIYWDKDAMEKDMKEIVLPDNPMARWEPRVIQI